MPDEYVRVRLRFLQNMAILQVKMDRIEEAGNTLKASKFYFREAHTYLVYEINNLVHAINMLSPEHGTNAING
jgi:hypothetical protein